MLGGLVDYAQGMCTHLRSRGVYKSEYHGCHVHEEGITYRQVTKKNKTISQLQRRIP